MAKDLLGEGGLVIWSVQMNLFTSPCPVFSGIISRWWHAIFLLVLRYVFIFKAPRLHAPSDT